MTEAEAIKYIRKTHCTENLRCHDNCMHGEKHCEYSVAIKALEKQIAKPVKELNDRKDLYVASCTVCGYLVYRNQRYCDGCGQKLDWSEV